MERPKAIDNIRRDGDGRSMHTVEMYVYADYLESKLADAERQLEEAKERVESLVGSLADALNELAALRASVKGMAEALTKIQDEDFDPKRMDGSEMEPYEYLEAMLISIGCCAKDALEAARKAGST